MLYQHNTQRTVHLPGLQRSIQEHIIIKHPYFDTFFNHWWPASMPCSLCIAFWHHLTQLVFQVLLQKFPTFSVRPSGVPEFLHFSPSILSAYSLKSCDPNATIYYINTYTQLYVTILQVYHL